MRSLSKFKPILVGREKKPFLFLIQVIRDSERQRFREGESVRPYDRYSARVWDRERVRKREGRPRERVYTQRAVDDRNFLHRRELRR